MDWVIIMNDANKEKFKKICKDIIMDEVYNNFHSINNINHNLNTQIQKLVKEINRLKIEIFEEIYSNKYKISINGIENISDILIENNITIKRKIIDIDCEIYYYKGENLYLINYDSVEDRWYLSLIDDNLVLIDEIYSDQYNGFIEYVKKTVI